MQCPRCGEPVQPSDTVCMSCDAPLGGQRPASRPAASPAPRERPRSSAGAASGVAAAGLKIAIWALVGIGAILLVGQGAKYVSLARVNGTWKDDSGLEMGIKTIGGSYLRFTSPGAQHQDLGGNCTVRFGVGGVPLSMTGTKRVWANCMNSDQVGTVDSMGGGDNQQESCSQIEFEDARFTGGLGAVTVQTGKSGNLLIHEVTYVDKEDVAVDATGTVEGAEKLKLVLRGETLVVSGTREGTFKRPK